MKPDFDQDHRPVPTVPFRYPETLDPYVYTEDDMTQARRETLYLALAALTTDINGKRIARRVIALAHLCGLPRRRDQKALAKELGVTESAVSQNLKSARKVFEQLQQDWRVPLKKCPSNPSAPNSPHP
jgi:Pyruvate/2-oxoacid:ferredoxin oxidoreductase gamma subunit